MRKLLTTFAFVMFMAYPAYAQGARDVSPDLIDEGQAALAAADLQTALKFFEQAMVADPANVDAYIGMGHTFAKAGSPSLSLKYYTIAAEIEPTNLTVLELQGGAYLKTDSPDEAKANLEKMKTVCLSGDCPEIGRLQAAITEATKPEEENGE